MNVTLNQAEQKLAIFLAKKRYSNARAKGVKDAKIGDQPCYETDLEGVASEIAFCKMFNLYPDLQTEEIPVHDAILHEGFTVDVKATKYKKGHLLATIKKCYEPSDLYALMIGEFPTYTFAGFASKSKLFREENIKDFGHGKGYAVNQSDLKFTYGEGK